MGPLIQSPHRLLESNINKITDRKFITNGEWDINLLTNVLPDNIIQNILSIDIGSLDLNGEPIWNLSGNGNYSKKSAWNNIRISKTRDSFLSKLWHKSLPFKFSFLSWRLSHGKLLFNEVVSRFGNQSNALCLCCNTPVLDFMQHTFSEGEAARQIWRLIAVPLGITHHAGPIRRNFKECWDFNSKNKVYSLILQVTPVIICWQIWKKWTTCKFGNQRKIAINKMEYQAIWNLQAILQVEFLKCSITGNWTIMCNIIERLKPMVIIKQVRWIKPDMGCIKLNLDRSYTSNNGRAGIGTAIRDNEGKIIVALSRPKQCNSNTQAEALTAKQGIQWCISKGYHRFQVEIDSQIISNMITNKRTTNMKIKKDRLRYYQLG
ncbi:uncharacterized protein LOC132039255 [Lycium ferocissimum]|uniref:uncharacterized protein LOC132039255 n=1 Tax=Lycium ferocissimum TaxID=112874 RepID=UPI0028151B99|nr:uncharacterized protein LOC132039255 [Lycium ferocissimum]